MKTLIITLEYPPQIGGIASYVHNLAFNLNPEEVVVWAPESKGDKDYDLKYQWHTYRGRAYAKIFWPRWLKWYWQIRKICKKEKIKRLFIHHVLPGGYIGYLIKKSLNIPYKIFLHGSDVEIALKKKKHKFVRILKFAEQVVVNSNFLKHKLLSKVENISEPTIIYPPPSNYFFNPVDEGEKINLKKQLALEGKKVIISVGRLAEGKGFPHLLRIMQTVLKNTPDAVLLLIGDGPKKNEILSLIQKFGLQNNVRYLGEVSNEKLPIYYQTSDIFVLLTHRDENAEEGWGTVFLEASASGLPVVAGQVGGVEEAVEHLRSGILVDGLQDIQVVGAISELLKNNEFSRQMGEYGRERVMRYFTWQKQLPLILGNYDE